MSKVDEAFNIFYNLLFYLHLFVVLSHNFGFIEIHFKANFIWEAVQFPYYGIKFVDTTANVDSVIRKLQVIMYWSFLFFPLFSHSRYNASMVESSFYLSILRSSWITTCRVSFSYTLSSSLELEDLESVLVPFIALSIMS